MRKLAVHAVALVVALVVVGSAFGGSLTSGYSGLGGVQSQVKSAVSKSAPAKIKGATAGTLPFTGLDLTLIVAGGLVLLAAGVGLHRAGRDKS